MQQVDHVKERPFHVNMGKLIFAQAEDLQLEKTRARFSNVLRRHGELTERLSRDSDRTVFERLQMEFEAARATQTQGQENAFSVWEGFVATVNLFTREILTGMVLMHTIFCLNELALHIKNLRRTIDASLAILFVTFESLTVNRKEEICLDGEQWNDGLLATIREQVHMEAEKKITSGDAAAMPIVPFHDKITYRVGNKLICCLEGARIGIQYETSFAGEPCELFHCVLESKSFLEKMIVLEHTIPFFLPIREAENEFLSSNAMKFIDHVGDLLQAYVDRREQVRLIKELYGNQIGELYFSLPYHMIEFVLADFNCKITVSLRYADLVAILPSGVSALAWPMQQRKSHSGAVIKPVPARLAYAEDALRSSSLPEAFAEIVLNLSRALKEAFSESNSA